eukprot:TRINITY_DN1967_c0_g2_i2.p2 TRINITY_DN1967_c0_g2~~TRINITY_DN1967_c0_g2_i2.p2  ORF type:complete len:102 (+),score=21.28 TRINITY_DN1967_c0_g2_i2:127-432(+)
MQEMSPMKGESAAAGGVQSCRTLDRVAGWVGAGVAHAFFLSLESCSCINLSTTDAEEEDYLIHAKRGNGVKALKKKQSSQGHNHFGRKPSQNLQISHYIHT